MSDQAVLRSFQLSPTGRDLLFVSADPATLGVIGREQNDTFVLSIAGARPAMPRKLTERGRFTWSPDGTHLLFAKGGRLMTMSVDGGPAAPWRESFTLSTGEPVWSPVGTRFAALVADPAVSDPEIEPVRPGMYTIAQPFMAVGVVLVQAGNKSGGSRDVLIGLGVVSVVLAWGVVHTVFALRYARLYYGEPVGGVDFNEQKDPDYRDFAYLAFTIGMTYQVSDTNLTSTSIRRTALHHALLSFVFGTSIIAMMINVVAGLLNR